MRTNGMNRDLNSKVLRRLLRWLGAWTMLGLLSACGGSGGGGATGEPPGGTDTTAQSFRLLPQRLGVAIGGDSALLAIGSGGTTTWSSSDPTVATVDAVGAIKALSKGTTIISATSGANVATSTLTVYRTDGANPDPTADALIAQALAQNKIDAEQALTYRIFALFGDERLPPEFDGAPSAGPDHLLLREMATTIASLSSSTQDVLRPFLLAPIYAESWYAQRLGLSAQAQATAALHMDATKKNQLEVSINCSASIAPDFYARVSTAHFNIFYMKFGDPAFDAGSASAVALIASLIEEVYQADTGLLHRFPVPDTNEACNGGDGAYDIYYGPFALVGRGGWTTTYPLAPGLIGNPCANRPSLMMLNKLSAEFIAAERSPAEARLMVKSVLAHEFLHALQLGMDRQASCKDTEWFDEATAQWVMDYVVPTIPQGLPGDFGMEPGLGRVAPNFQKSGPDLAEYLYSGHMVSIEKPGAEPKRNGYSDYLFFQFLARKQTPDKIRQIFDAMAGGKNSVEAIAAAVDMKSVWPEFAKTLWIGVDDKVLDYWATEDEYRFGLADVYAQVPVNGIDQKLQDKLKSLKIDQKGEKSAKFELLKNAMEFEGYLIHPRSFFYEHLKFTDATVHSVYLFNPIGAFPNAEFMKVEAVKKIGGQWQASEDWTKDTYKQFCLDKKDERLEELILIVSNSETNPATEKPFTIPLTVPMQISTSNVGCWKWQGTASSVATATVPPTDQTGRGTNVTFEVASILPGRIVFETTAGVINGMLTQTGACTITMVGADKTASNTPVPDGTIDVNLDLDLGFGGIGGKGPDRSLVTLSGSSTLSTTTTETCPTFTRTVVGNQGWDWLRVDDPSVYTVSNDGQTIEGRFTGSTPVGATITSVWKFTALRE